MSEQISMGSHTPSINVDYENNREERLPCVLVVDASRSMAKNDAIVALNKGLAEFAAALKRDPVAALRVQLMVVRVGGGVEKLCEWTDADLFAPPQLFASGDTPLGAGVSLAMQLVEEQLADLRARGIARKRPWIWVMSDGQPTDAGWQAIAQQARDAQIAKRFFLYPVSVILDPADSSHTATLRAFSAESKCIQIQEAEFEAFFQFISEQSKAGSRTEGGDVSVYELAGSSLSQRSTG